MAFQGSLAELHLPDIIQLVSVSGKTGVFHLTDRGHRGEIYLVEGRIVHAELEDLAGEEAVYALAIWQQGDFRFDAEVTTPRQTIQKNNTNLLMEAARRLDEWRVLSKKIPSVDLVPEFVVQENREGQINLNTMEWLLLSKIDGHRSLKAIAAATGMGVFDSAKLLYGLVATGLIRVREPGEVPVAPGPAAARAPSATPPAAPLRAAPATARSAARPASSAPASPPVARSRPGPSAPPAATPAPAAPAAANPAAAPVLARLGQVRDACAELLGPVGETVVHKHYQRARAEIERGAGAEAIEDAVQQIARAAAILKGAPAAEAILQLLKSAG
jgi:hypothetical protein